MMTDASASAPRPVIIDLSSNNNTGHVPTVGEFELLRRSYGVIGVIVKATGGGDPGGPFPPFQYKNPLYGATRDNAVAAGIPTIAYHFWQPGEDPVVQAAFFVGVAGKPWARVLDIETGTDFAAYAKALEALPLSVTERALYGSLSAFSGQAVPAQKWIADYGVDAPGQPPDPEIEAEVRAAGATMWQFGSDETLPGLVGAVDESIWLGSETEFRALFHVPANN